MTRDAFFSSFGHKTPSQTRIFTNQNAQWWSISMFWHIQHLTHHWIWCHSDYWKMTIFLVLVKTVIAISWLLLGHILWFKVHRRSILVIYDILSHQNVIYMSHCDVTVTFEKKLMHLMTQKSFGHKSSSGGPIAMIKSEKKLFLLVWDHTNSDWRVIWPFCNVSAVAIFPLWKLANRSSLPYLRV